MELSVYSLHPLSDLSRTEAILQGNVDILPEPIFRSKPIININSNDSQVIFKVDSCNKLLSFHINTLGHFISISLLVLDSHQRPRKITLTNKKSKIVIYEKDCTIPMKIGNSWQYICIDMADMMRRAFGLEFNRCTQVSLQGMSKLSSVYLHDKEYADVQLPPHLQVYEHA